MALDEAGAAAMAEACAAEGVAFTTIGELAPADRPSRWIGPRRRAVPAGVLKYEHAFRA